MGANIEGIGSNRLTIQGVDRLQGTAYEGYERTIDVHVRNLRSKIEPSPHLPRYVETVYGVGYRFAAETETEG